MSRLRHIPISLNEFGQKLAAARPPIGWPASIAVANSGGPDSTCLLHLLSRYLTVGKAGSYQNIFSFSIDHDLQDASADMAKTAEKSALSMGVQHRTRKVEWNGQNGGPKRLLRPEPGQPFEALARLARHWYLLELMKENDVNVIMFGHHADDQIETGLMRLASGSTATGAAGMLPVRRWGMGSPEDGPADHYGMNRFIVRPLLDFPKVSLFSAKRKAGAHVAQYLLEQDPCHLRGKQTRIRC